MICTRAEVLIALGKASSISDADLALLDMVHPLAESAIKSYLQQDVGYAQHIELFPIGQASQPDDSLEDVRKQGESKAAFSGGHMGSEALQLKHLPVVTTGMEIREDSAANAGQASGAFDSSTVLEAGVDYWLDVDEFNTNISRTGLVYRYGNWPAEARTVKVTYYGGFTDAQLNGDIGGAIKYAAIETVMAAYKTFKVFQNGGTGPKQSESIGKYSYSNSAGAMQITNMSVAIPFSARELLQPFRNYGRYIA